jgi:GH25 family lysozyme M1 (1,4-beta-N-acetylmuramidase)
MSHNQIEVAAKSIDEDFGRQATTDGGVAAAERELSLQSWKTVAGMAPESAVAISTSRGDIYGSLPIIVAAEAATDTKRHANAPTAFPVKGIDLYEKIGSVDFDKVGNAGYQFVIPRASYGTRADKGFVNYVQQARAAGLRVGAYCFFRPSQDVETQAETCATQVKAAAGTAAGDIGVVADFENAKAFKNIPRAERTKELSSIMAEWKAVPQATRLGLVRQYLDDIQAKTGQQPLIYGSSKFFSAAFFGDLTPLGKYDLWVADYNKRSTPEVPEPWKSGKGWTLWQTTPKGRVPGQKPNADIDVFNGDQSTFNQHFGERAPANPSN